MNNENFNQELTIVGLLFCLVINFGVYTKTTLESEKRLQMIAQATDIIEEQDIQLANYSEMLDSMNRYADDLEEEISQMKDLDKILKDLARSWSGK